LELLELFNAFHFPETGSFLEKETWLVSFSLFLFFLLACACSRLHKFPQDIRQLPDVGLGLGLRIRGGCTKSDTHT
jgi:hypothetical protein